MRSSLLVFLFTLFAAGLSAQIFTSQGAVIFGVAVIGRPYSGEQIDETMRTLADRPHVHRNVSSKIYRDSQGRTRTEVPITAGTYLQNSQDSPVIVTIFDPVAGVNYTFDTQSRVVHRFALPSPSSLPHLSPGSVPSSVSIPQSKTEKLDSRVIEGVRVEGIRETVNYPAFVRTSETWTSPELGIAILSKSTNPHGVDHISKLIHVSRDEPDPSLFQPPAGYRITDEPMKNGIISTRQP